MFSRTRHHTHNKAATRGTRKKEEASERSVITARVRGFMAEEDASKRMQVLVTFAIGGIVSIGLWPYLETVSKGLIVLFALLAGLSINNGTWMQNARELRREQREQRRQVYREAQDYLFGGNSKRT